MSKKSDIERINEITPIVELLGEKRVEELKDRICDVIIKRVEEDFDAWERYICYPPDFNYIFDEAYESIEKKLKKMYVDKVLEVAQKTVENMCAKGDRE